MKIKIPKKISKIVAKTMFAARKAAPDILTYVGIGAVGVAGVMACKNTYTELGDILDEHKETLELIDAISEEDYETAKQKNVDIIRCYVHTGVNIAKLYAPSVVIAGLGVASIVAGHKIIKARWLSAAAAYDILNKKYENYRANVVNTEGDEADKKYATPDYDMACSDENFFNGTYARFFDENNDNYLKRSDGTADNEYNYTWLKGVESRLNKKLSRDRYIFLNDVYMALGYEPTIAGWSVGWIFDDDDPNADGQIKFVPDSDYIMHNERYEHVFYLDFNCSDIVMKLKNNGILATF